MKRIEACRVELFSRLKWPLPPMSTLTVLAMRTIAKRRFETTQRAANMALIRLTRRIPNKTILERGVKAGNEAACVCCKTGTGTDRCAALCFNMVLVGKYLLGHCLCFALLCDRFGEGQQQSCSRRWSVWNKIRKEFSPKSEKMMGRAVGEATIPITPMTGGSEPKIIHSTLHYSHA